jgi:hypothetical protein
MLEFGRHIFIGDEGVTVLVAQFEYLRAGEEAHRMALTHTGIDPDPHRTLSLNDTAWARALRFAP